MKKLLLTASIAIVAAACVVTHVQIVERLHAASVDLEQLSVERDCECLFDAWGFDSPGQCVAEDGITSAERTSLLSCVRRSYREHEPEAPREALDWIGCATEAYDEAQVCYSDLSCDADYDYYEASEQCLHWLDAAFDECHSLLTTEANDWLDGLDAVIDAKGCYDGVF